MRFYIEPKYGRGSGRGPGPTPRTEDAVCYEHTLRNLSLVDLDSGESVGPRLGIICTGHNPVHGKKCLHTARLIVEIREYDEKIQWLTQSHIDVQCLECATESDSMEHKTPRLWGNTWPQMQWFRKEFGLGRVVETLRGPRVLVVNA